MNWQYYSKDTEKDIAFTMKSHPSGFEYNIGEYKESTKKLLDEALLNGEKVNHFKILEFSSIFNRKKDMYIATILSFNKNENLYKATKQIIKGKKTFVWTVMSFDIKDTEDTFNGYKDYIKVIE